MHWWFRLFRIVIFLLLSVIYAASGALFPYWYQTNNDTLLLISWAVVHLLGRLQVCLLMPFWQSYRDSVPMYEPKLRICLEAPSIIRKEVSVYCQSQLWEMRRMEIILFDFIPLLLSLMFRYWMLEHLGGVSWWGSTFYIGSFVVIGFCSYLGVMASKHYEHRVKKQYRLQSEKMMHWITYGNYPREKMTVYWACYYKEAVKLLVGLWVFLGLWLSTHQQQTTNRLQLCLLLVTWMGSADLVWGLWQAWVEFLGYQRPKKRIEAPITQNTTRLHFDKLQLFPGSQPISVELLPGQMLWVRGANGSGKTTLMKVILGLRAASGSINDNQGIAKKDTCVLSANMTPVCGKLRDYISEETAEIVELQKAINQLPKGFETPLSELQSHWSLGMLQRLNLAWALQQKKALYLLDEACNHLPTQTANMFYHRLKKQGAMVVVVSHQPVLKQLVDKFIYLSVVGPLVGEDKS